jgi:hypothetical protein
MQTIETTLQYFAMKTTSGPNSPWSTFLFEFGRLCFSMIGR